jgi:hypothetical protein
MSRLPHTHIPFLFDGITIIPNNVIDDCLGRNIPLNDTGTQIAQYINGQHTVGQLVSRLRQLYGVSEQDANAQISALLIKMNQHFIVGFKRNESILQWSQINNLFYRWMFLPIENAKMLLTTYTPWQRETLALGTLSDALNSFVKILLNTIKSYTLLLLVAIMVFFFFGLVTKNDKLLLQYVAIPPLIFVGVFVIGAAAHEFCHAFMGYCLNRTLRPVFVYRKFSLKILFFNLTTQQRKVVAVAGPMANGLLAALTSPLLFVTMGTARLWVFAALLGAGVGAISALPFFGDGRMIWYKDREN